MRVLHLERVEPTLLSCLADVDVESSYKPKNKTAETEEEHSGLAEPQNAAWTDQSVNMGPDPGIDMEREVSPVRQKQQLKQQHRE